MRQASRTARALAPYGGGPWFDNQVGTLTIDGRHIDVRLERLTADAEGARLETVLERRLA